MAKPTYNHKAGSFDFSRRVPDSSVPLAQALANLHSGELTDLLDRCGIKYAKKWPQQCPSPSKPNFACDIVKTLDSAQMKRVWEEMPKAEKAGEARFNANSKGRPPMYWSDTVMGDLRGNNFGESIYQQQAAAANQNDQNKQDGAKADKADSAQDFSSMLRDVINSRQDAKGDSQNKQSQNKQSQNKQSQNKQSQNKQDGQGKGDGNGSGDNESPLEREVRKIVADKIQQMQDEGTITSGMGDDMVEKIKTMLQDITAKMQDASGSPRPITVTIEKQDDDGAQKRDIGLQHKCFPKLLKYVNAGMKIWVPGPAGSGKTTAAINVAESLGLSFYHIGAIDTEYKLFGFRDANGNVARTAFREAYENGGVFLWDEVDASNPQALLAMNAAIENGSAAFPDGIVKMHKNFRLIASANTYGHGATHQYIGRNKIDDATLDRFVVIDWPYDEALERAIVQSNGIVDRVQAIRRAVAELGIKVIVSPRASMNIKRILEAGIDSIQEAETDALFKGLSEDQVMSILRKANLERNPRFTRKDNTTAKTGTES